MSKWFNYEEVKMIYAEILYKDKKETLIKDLTTIYKIKNIFLIDKEFIKVCYNSWADEHLKVKFRRFYIKKMQHRQSL